MSDAATLTPAAATASKPRPRFSREVLTPTLDLPAGKRIGAVLAVTRTRDGDLFILHQPNAQGLDPEVEGADYWLPPIVRFSADDRFLAAWGGPEHVPAVAGIAQWPVGAEGLECDAEGNLWVFGYRQGDNAVLKFSPDGELLMRIGERGRTGGDDDTRYLDRPTSCYHDVDNNEVFVADGYGNRRVIAFDARTGAFTRMWGAYGKPPTALPPEEGYASPVHKIVRGPNGLVYVADRKNSRVQEFRLTPDGVEYLREVYVARGTNVYSTGSCWDVSFTPGGAYMLVADGANFRVWSVDLATLEVLGATTVHDEHETEVNRPLVYTLVHRFFVEPNGDLLLACVNRGLRKLTYEGVR